jgi:Putative zinc-finger
VSCDPERVTAFVDGELDAAASAAVTAHLETCADCRAQAGEERALRSRLRELPAPELPALLEARVRRMARRRGPGVVRWALPVAAALLVALWLRGHAPMVAWDLARDHDMCFAHRPVPAKVWSAEPRVVADWFEARGTVLPNVLARVGDVTLVGARYCPLLGGSFAPHLYYASKDEKVSVFVVPYGVRFEDRFAGGPRGRFVRLLRVDGEVVGVVGESEADVRDFETALRPVLAAWLGEARMLHAR